MSVEIGRCCTGCGVFASDGESLEHADWCQRLGREIVPSTADPTPHGVCMRVIGTGRMVAHMAGCRA